MSLKKILLVEDEFLIALNKQRQLENYGYHVEHIASGEEAVSYVLQESKDIDLILMDINLGQMPGTEAAKNILSRKEIPIVFFSSHSEPEIVKQTENITSYGYVLKDASIVVLDASIKMALKLFEANKKLKRSEKFRERIFESSQIPFVILETEGFSCLDCNNAALKLYGFSEKSEIYGKTLLDFSAPTQYDGSSSEQKVKSILNLALTDGSVFFEWRNQRLNGQIWDTEIQMLSFKTEGKIMLQYAVFDVTEKRRLDLEMKKSQLRIAHQRTAIAQMVSDPEIFGKDLNIAFKKINNYITATLQVNRSGIWILNNEQSELSALSTFDTKKELSGYEATLKTSDFPNYFRTIIQENRIYCEDTLVDPRTSELKDYFNQFGIRALLDAGFFVDGKLKGVICSEHVGESRKWHTDEESFISTVAAIVGQLFVREAQLVVR